ncbi:hypothetical protein V5N11_007215 [Cardamine amara subsp. amara]|uniref:Zinc finger PHD-type domain-containing protein n=1 Tax=Cardamine amara subsp. amara TaxID=228776 RepID=A0ABD0ZZG3_CARAN
MDSEGVLLPLIHEHLMMPWNDLIPERGDCCGRLKDINNGYYCKNCKFFVHKECSESSKYIEHPSHRGHTLQLRRKPYRLCDLCRWDIKDLGYHCGICEFDVDLYCAKYPPPEVIGISETHPHKLILLKEQTVFNCGAKCGKTGDAFPYKCHECDLSFHVECVWHPSEVKQPLEVNHQPEVNHSYHSLHSLKLLTDRLPDYSDGKCRLCGTKKVGDKLFYHCSSCNFTLDMRCVLQPPPQSLLDLKTHDHQLTLLPRLISFTCNACGLKGDRSPYLCVQCDFVIHQDCIGLPRVININRHDHRVSRTSLLGVVNSVCGVCRQKVDWTCGGYSCQDCPDYVVHSKCATRNDVWNGKELEGVPEDPVDIEPYVVIDDNTIRHFSHQDHYLRLHVNGSLCEDNKHCNACTHPVSLQSFYSCIDCDFTLHQICAEFPRKKRHVLHNERLTLVTTKDDLFQCTACHRFSNGFRYQHGNKSIDLRCSSISEPFVHLGHPHHPLYYPSPFEEVKNCNGCNKSIYHMLRCIEKDCGFVLGFECATLPQVVKHRVDDHPLSLCYGEEASGKYWCDICEKETNPKTWFYTCKDHHSSLHTQCVFGDFSGVMPGSTIYGCEVVLNSSMFRPFCYNCKSRCNCPIVVKVLDFSDVYFCSFGCMIEQRKKQEALKL